ncbi:uncharacterized protein LOC135805596 isoform X1 [Sycon ciliatum]|uniref:uncharacterized protein LOC135805596 isoform X1 n=1 Tax=Sycon ciliatum TaxID=27933 RepID=UPI0031F637A4
MSRTTGGVWLISAFWLLWLLCIVDLPGVAVGTGCVPLPVIVANATVTILHSATASDVTMATGTTTAAMTSAPPVTMVTSNVDISVGVTLQYRCETGHVIAINNVSFGVPQLSVQCMAGGVWTGGVTVAPTCEYLPCAYSAAPANAATSGVRFTRTADGSVVAGVDYICNTGYHVTGSLVSTTVHSLTCQYGSGQWNGTLPTCTKVQCGPPFPAVQRSFLVKQRGNDLTFNSSVSLYCSVAAYHIAGYDTTVKEKSAVCQANGEWSEESFPPAGCVLVECPNLRQAVPNAELDHNDYTVYMRIVVTCLPGYTLNGVPDGDNTTTARCGETGAWLPGVPVCSSPPPLPPPDPTITTTQQQTSSPSTSSQMNQMNTSTTQSTTSQSEPLGTSQTQTSAARHHGTILVTSSASTSPTQLPQSDSGGAGTGVVLAIIIPCALVGIILIVLMAYYIRRRELKKRPCEPWETPLTMGSQRRNTPLDSSSSYVTPVSANGRSGPRASAQSESSQSQYFDDPIYYKHNTTRSFAGTLVEEPYGRIQANVFYSSPVSPARSPPSALTLQDSAVDSPSEQAATTGGVHNGALSLYKRPVPNSPPLYYEVNESGDADSPQASSPYSNIGQYLRPQDQLEPGGGRKQRANSAGHTYNTVRQPPPPRLLNNTLVDENGHPLLHVDVEVTMNPTPVYYCLENTSPLQNHHLNNTLTDSSHQLSEDDLSMSRHDSPHPYSSIGGADSSDNGDPSSLEATAAHHTYSIPNKTMKAVRATTSETSGAGPAVGPAVTDGTVVTNSAATTVDVKKKSSGSTIGEWSADHRARSNRRTIEELDKVSSDAASMLHRQRSRSLSAAERKQKKQKNLKKLRDDAAAHDSDPTLRRMPVTPPPRRDSMATGLRSLTAARSHLDTRRTDGEDDHQPATPLQKEHRKRSRSAGHVAKRRPVRDGDLDESMLELTTDL